MLGIDINEEKYGDCLTDEQALDLLKTVIHEGVHWSYPFWADIPDPRQDDDVGRGTPYDEAERLLPLVAEQYMNERKERCSCECSE